MHTTPHPVEPEQEPSEQQRSEPDPTHLPVEPEFGPMLPAAEPEDPGVSAPKI